LIQVVQDQSSKPTTGKILSYTAPPYATTDITGVVIPKAGYNDVNISVSASHQLSIISHIVTGGGKSSLVKWTQDLSFHNFQSYTQDANYQVCKRIVQRCRQNSFLSNDMCCLICTIPSYHSSRLSSRVLRENHYRRITEFQSFPIRFRTLWILFIIISRMEIQLDVSCVESSVHPCSLY
jgi:hypothetical protein